MRAAVLIVRILRPLFPEKQEVNYFQDSGGVNYNQDDIPDNLAVACGVPQGNSFPDNAPQDQGEQPGVVLEEFGRIVHLFTPFVR